MGRLWPPLVGLLALYMDGQGAPANWPGGAASWALAAALLLLLAVFGFLGLSSGFFQAAVVRFASLFSRDWDRANRFYFLLMRPGVLAHETAHAVAAMLVGGKVTSFNVLETKLVATGRGDSRIRLGHVAYMVPGRGGIGWRLKDAFVGFAPLPVGLALVVLAIALSGFDPAPGLLPALQSAAGDWRSWLAVLVILEVADNMIPSSADRKNMPAALLALAVLLVVGVVLWNIAAQQGWQPPQDWAANLAGWITLLALVLLAPVAINLVLGGMLRLIFALLRRR